jgi:hypothetical protein
MNPNLRQAMDQFDRESLSVIPTMFGRIVYLSSLRDGIIYREPLLQASLGSDDAQAVLSKLHCALVIAWLRLTMQERHDDIRQYLATETDQTVAKKWLRGANISEVLPEDLSATDRELFVSELHVLLAIMRLEGST